MSTVSLTRSLHMAALEKSEAEWPGEGLERLVTLENVRLQIAGANWTPTARHPVVGGVVLATRTLQNCSQHLVTRTWEDVVGRVPESFRWTLDRNLSGATPPREMVPLPAGITIGGEAEIEIDTDVAGGAVARSHALSDTLTVEAPGCSKVRARLVARKSREEGLLDLQVMANADAEVVIDARSGQRGGPREVQRFRISLVTVLTGTYEAVTWTDVEQEHTQLPCECPPDSPCASAARPSDEEPFIGPDMVDEPTATSIPPTLPPLSFRSAPRPPERTVTHIEITAVRIDPPEDTEEAPVLEPEPEPEPAPEQAPEQPPEQPPGLAAIEGIGQRSVEKLAAAGIQTLEDLAQSHPKRLKIEGISLRRLTAWRDAAAELLKRP